jgi:hypothetical protein
VGTLGLRFLNISMNLHRFCSISAWTPFLESEYSVWTIKQTHTHKHTNAFDIIWTVGVSYVMIYMEYSKVLPEIGYNTRPCYTLRHKKSTARSDIYWYINTILLAMWARFDITNSKHPLTGGGHGFESGANILDYGIFILLVRHALARVLRKKGGCQKISYVVVVRNFAGL